MGILGLRKYVDASGCTRLLPVPLPAGEQQQQHEEEEEYDERNEEEEAYTAANGKSSSGSSGDEKRRRGEGDHEEGGSGEQDDNTLACSSPPSPSPSPLSFRPYVPMADHVLVDMNCIVHSCFGKDRAVLQRSKAELIQDVLERLRVLLTQVVAPRKSLTICLDGPAPLAKLQTQRLRRRRVALMDTAGTNVLTSLAITAGSLFMVELENALAAQFKLHHGRGFLSRLCPVYLHGTTVMGEGEAKVSRALAFLASHGTQNNTEDEEAEGRGSRAGTTRSPSSSSSQHTYKRYNNTGNNTRNSMREGRAGWKKAQGSRHASHTSSKDHTHPTPATASPPSYHNLYSSPYNPNDSVVILGNDIDLVLTGLAATMYHNITILGPSSLQAIELGEMVYHWLRASPATGAEAAPITPAQLPSVRIDFVFLFLLNGGDHYVGAGEVALTLWKRYRVVRAAYPNDSLVSPSLDAVSVEFLADVVQSETYTGTAEASVGLQLVHAALWSLYTVVTGECTDYGYCPAPSAPYIHHLRAAARACREQRRRYIKLPHAPFASNGSAGQGQEKRNERRPSAQERKTPVHGVPQEGAQPVVREAPLTPLETFVALMPSEAAMPASIAETLRQPAQYALGQRLLLSQDAQEIARVAAAVVRAAHVRLTRSEQYLRQFTPPVQLNVLPPRRRLSRHEQHRLRALQGNARLPLTRAFLSATDVVPIVQGIAIPSVDPRRYNEAHYPPECKALYFRSPFASVPDTNKGGAKLMHCNNMTKHKAKHVKQNYHYYYNNKNTKTDERERRVVYLRAKAHTAPSAEHAAADEADSPHTSHDAAKRTKSKAARSENGEGEPTATSSVAATVRRTLERVLRNEHRRQARQQNKIKNNKNKRKNNNNKKKGSSEEEEEKVRRCVMRPSAAVSSKLHSAQELGEKRLREEDARRDRAHHRLRRREAPQFLQQLREFVGEKDVVRALGLEEEEERATAAGPQAKGHDAAGKTKNKKNKNKNRASKTATRPTAKSLPAGQQRRR